MRRTRSVWFWGLGLVSALCAFAGDGNDAKAQHEPIGEQTFTSPQANPIAVSQTGERVYVANTTSGTVDVIDAESNTVVATVPVGLDPVAVAVRPDDREVWIANHISDSVSVIDTDPQSPTFLQVIDTVQSMGSSLVTTFDEPVGIAFANDAKAYVALSSRNQIAVVDVPHRRVTKILPITAQDPRALTVADGKLFVAAFESHNQTSLSSCPLYYVPFIGVFELFPVELCTLSVLDLLNFVTNPNLPGVKQNIVVDPGLPDRDVFVFDTNDDSLIDVVEGVGTLLYGIAADSAGRAYVTNTDGLNDVNGVEDGVASDLIALGNRMFDNRITKIECETTTTRTGFLWWRRTVTTTECNNAAIHDVDDISTPATDALATPYGIAVSNNGKTLIATAAGTSRLFTVDAASGAVLGMLDLGNGNETGDQIPRGVALRCKRLGDPKHAYVLNTLENTVSVVDVRVPANPTLITKIPVGNDPTDETIRKGRIAFNTAFASDSGNFSCASCHPDGNTDQLIWRIGGACFFQGFLSTGTLGSLALRRCSEDDEPRTTMPIRGLRNTLPLHWDGALGDPIGGPNGAVGLNGDAGKSCLLGDADGDLDCFRDLVDASLSGVMCDQLGGCKAGPSGLPGRLNEQERDDMAAFLTGVAYPPPRSRPIDDRISAQARDGFRDFFTDQGTKVPSLFLNLVGVGDLKSCGQSSCHQMPLMGTTNSILGAFDVPTLRGLTDRWVQFSNGLTQSRGFLELAGQELPDILIRLLSLVVGFEFEAAPEGARYDFDIGFDERTTLAAIFLVFEPVYNVGPIDIFQMVEEMSTGYSGALGRQAPLNARSTAGGNASETNALLAAFEAADDKELVNLRVVGVRANQTGYGPIVLSYGPNGRYADGALSLSRAQLIAEAKAGDLIATATSHLPEFVQSFDLDQPLLSTDFASDDTPNLPILPWDNPFELNGIDIFTDSTILVDGDTAPGSVECVGASFSPYCESGRVAITLEDPPSDPGLHLLQVVTPKGLTSNEVPICVNGCD